MQCPLCDTALPDGAGECTRCDWVREPAHAQTETEDWTAVALSVVPGLGQLYKGHLVPGILIFCAIGPALLGLSLILVPATLGVSLVMPAIFMGIVATHAFHLHNARRSPGVRAQANITIREWLGAVRHLRSSKTGDGSP